MTEIRVPTLGESVTEATIGRWFKKAGEPSAATSRLVELETDKVTVEVPAPAAGVLGEIAAKDGETVAVGALLGAIAEGGAAAAKPAAAPAKAAAPPGRAPPPAAGAAPRRRRPPPADAPLAPSARRSPPKPASTPRPSPAPARMAASPRATCWPRSNGRLAPTPVDQPAAAVSARRPAPTMPRAKSACTMTRLRQTIARRLKEAQNTAAMLTTFNEVDMSRGDGAARRSTRTCSRRSTASSWASWASSPRPASRR